MKNNEPLFFEITNKKNVIRIELSEVFNEPTDCNWDKNYIRAMVHYNSGIFQGPFETVFMTVDFEKFKRDLKKIYKTDDGFAEFECLEKPLKLILTGNGEGHFYLTHFEPATSQTHKLEFELSFDKKYLLSIINQLERITAAFPIIGNEFRITHVLHPNNRPLPTNGLQKSHLYQGLAIVNN